MDAGTAPALISGIARRIDDATTADEAVAALAEELQGRLPVTRVSVRILRTGDDTLVSTGVWSRSATSVTTGIALPVHATSFMDVARAGRAIRSTWDASGRPPPLLHQVMADEGNLAWVLIPLEHDGIVRGVLSVSTWDELAITDDDLPFFDELGRSFGQRLLALSTRPTF